MEASVIEASARSMLFKSGQLLRSAATTASVNATVLRDESVSRDMEPHDSSNGQRLKQSIRVASEMLVAGSLKCISFI